MPLEPAGPAAYLLSLEVEGVRCFKDRQVLDLSDGQGRPAQWTVLLGDNGTGKTTLLWSLLSAAPLEDDVEPAVNLMASMLVGEGSSARFWAMWDVRNGARQRRKVERRWGRRGGSYNGGPFEGAICIGYGAGRHMAATQLSKERPGPVDSLLDPHSALLNAEEWLLRLHYDALLEGNDARLQQAVGILVGLLPNVETIELPKKGNGKASEGLSGRVLFHTPYGPVPLKGLSLGYQTMIAWIVDLAARLFDAYPDLEDPLSGPAVVLVDEIDLHLHPSWQRSLLDFLSVRFPNVQFIATAHSPLVVQAAQDANLVVLRREGDRVVIDNDPESVRGWRVDQILTSELFGLDSARPPREARLLQERTHLLSQPSLGNGERQRLDEIEAELRQLPTADTPEEREAMDLIRQAAQAIKEHSGK